MIVTGEASGDLHGANLVKALLQKQPGIHFCGMGGPELSRLGVEILCDARDVSVIGIAEVFSHLPAILRAQKILYARLKENPPAQLIIIDLPDFNLILAKKAKKLGIPVFYYITPQVWAWRKGRVKTIAARCDQLGVILPFEEEFFKNNGVAAQYVGHPLLDHVKVSLTRNDFCKKYNLNNEDTFIGLLPGSRSREIQSLLPTFLASAVNIQETSSDKLTFLLPKAPTISRSELESAGLIEYEKKIDIHVIEEDRYDLMAHSSAVVAASGTVTLELAILQVPMVVCYKTSWLSYQLGKRLIDLDYFSLVNLIGKREIVTELLQDDVNPERVALDLYDILYGAKKVKVCEGLKEVCVLLGTEGASMRAARLSLSLLNK